MNECAVNNGSCSDVQTCVNTLGSFECLCPREGFMSAPFDKTLCIGTCINGHLRVIAIPLHGSSVAMEGLVWLYYWHVKLYEWLWLQVTVNANAVVVSFLTTITLLQTCMWYHSNELRVGSTNSITYGNHNFVHMCQRY